MTKEAKKLKLIPTQTELAIIPDLPNLVLPKNLITSIEMQKAVLDSIMPSIKMQINMQEILAAHARQFAEMATAANQLRAISEAIDRSSVVMMAKMALSLRETLVQSLQGIFAGIKIPPLVFNSAPEDYERIQKELPEQIPKTETAIESIESCLPEQIDKTKIARKEAEIGFDLIAEKIFPTFIELKNGSIYCQGKLIDFRPRNCIQKLLLIALLNKSDHTGFCSYQEIDRYITEVTKKKLHNYYDRIKRIHNALNSLYRPHKRRLSFPEFAPDGNPVITKLDGEGLRLNNPRLFDIVYKIADTENMKIALPVPKD